MTNQSPFKLLTKQIQEERESNWLSIFATRSCRSLGRIYTEDESQDYRTTFQHDKDRVIHSTAFRRLEYKTQVFVNHEGDHYRTRLTHTLEVAQIARTVARALRLNEDLTEAIALGHDLGHTPFGHAGERTLNNLMTSHGGFEHNAQALRIVDILEDRYPEFPGLNLSAEVRRGLLKEKQSYPGEGNDIAPHTPIEARVVDLADEIAYNSHDCDDGLESGLLVPESLRQVDLWIEAETEMSQRFPQIGNKKRRMATVRALIDRQVQDVIAETLIRMQHVESRLNDGQELTPILLEAAWPAYSPEMKPKNQQLKECLRAELYTHPRVVSAMSHSVPIIERLFSIYHDNPERLPATTRSRIETAGRERTVADYIAGMTDRYAEALDRMFAGK